MTDPISIAGTAVGVVSLGLQVYSGAKQYLDHFHARDERVSVALTYLDQLKAAVDVVDGATRSLQVQHQIPADVVLSCLRVCMAEMRKLQGKLEEFMPSHQNSSNNKLKQIKKKLEYPFQIDSIEEIEKGLRRILDQLSIAIHGLELHSHQTISSNVNALGDSMKAQADVLSRITADSEIIRKINVDNATQLTTIGLNVQPLKPTLQALESVIDTRFEDFENQVQSNHYITNGHLNVLEHRSVANSQAMTEVLTILRHLRDQSQFTDRNFIGNHLVGSLVSKPSLLKDVHNSSDLQQEGIKPHPNSALNDPTRIASEDPRFCGCSSWRRVKQRNIRWHAFDFFSTEVTVLVHRPSCSRYRGNSSQRQRTFGITCIGLRQLLSVACSVSLTLNFGAGGTSVSPSFRCYNMVDEFQSPPFRMIRILYRASNKTRLLENGNIKRIAIDCISWIRVAYDRGVASPWDVSSDNLTLVDYFVRVAMSHIIAVCPDFSDPLFLDPLTITALFNLGVASTRHQDLVRNLGLGLPAHVGKSLGSIASLLLRNAPNCQYQWHSTAIDLLYAGDVVRQSNEISAAVELELDPICTVLLRQDMNALSRILATKPKRWFESNPAKSLFELAVRWPAGLNHILEMDPCFFNSKEIKALLRNATSYTQHLCKEGSWSCLCSDCSCSESAEILLNHGCALTSQDISRIFKTPVSMNTRHTILQHLRLWRQKLQECLRLYQSVGPQDELTADDPNILDHEAPHAVQTLQSIGIDPFKMFGLQQGDYRLGCSLDEPFSIYFVVRNPTTAQMAFDLGFRDIDVLCKGATPLSKAAETQSDLLYCLWLIDKGADYARESVWNIKEQNQKPNTVSNPHYSIIHRIFRLLALFFNERKLKRWVSKMISSPCFSLFTQTSYYDGCSCACLSSPEGCSPFSIYLNRILKDPWRLLRPPHVTLRKLIDTIHTFASSVENSSMLAESAFRCLTFHRLGIRHTCCASITGESYRVLPADYGSDFDELREEDEYRVHQLNELVAGFMDQYNNGALTLEEFVIGPWTEQMDHIEAEERERIWTTQEKNKFLSIGVLVEDEPANVSGDDETDTDDYLVGDEKRMQPEYWNRQFEIIANGGRSKEEDRCFY
ncbi:hypothetical protein F4680DRAFT_404447 [Xylaria scruposa]|nr:hypothetical protein F4680DRAFT_404447 [Xylaria scruposa]